MHCLACFPCGLILANVCLGSNLKKLNRSRAHLAAPRLQTGRNAAFMPLHHPPPTGQLFRPCARTLKRPEGRAPREQCADAPCVLEEVFENYVAMTGAVSTEQFSVEAALNRISENVSRAMKIFCNYVAAVRVY